MFESAAVALDANEAGQDGHDRGSKVIATAFGDAGFDIDLSPMFSTPAEVARQAVENDVHVIGVSSQAAGHKTLIPLLVEELGKADADDIIVIVGGVIPKKDYAFLEKSGVGHLWSRYAHSQGYGEGASDY